MVPRLNQSALQRNRMMNQTILVRRETNRSGALAVGLSLLVACGPVFTLTAQAQGRQSSRKSTLTGDQRVAHVLSRLTFGARPGDFERVKAMGVDAFINQQLDPDSIDSGAVIAKLRRLPTLNMATPVIIEQYTPPKPVVAPSPLAARGVENSTSQAPNLMTQNQDAGRMPALQSALPAPKPLP